MNNLVQFLDPLWRTARRAKRYLGQARTIDASVGIQDFSTKAADDFLIDSATGLHQPVRHGVGLNQVGSEFDKHLAHSGLAARDATGKADF
jgi:hypothetical protein